MGKIEGAKYDIGKLKYSRVPPEALDAIAVVRDFGHKKYGDAENWRSISPDRWHEALLRHVREIWEETHATSTRSLGCRPCGTLR